VAAVRVSRRLMSDVVTISARSWGTPYSRVGDTSEAIDMGDIAPRRATRVAWSMVIVYTAGLGVGTMLGVANGDFREDPAEQVTLLLAFTAFMVVGTVIVARRPSNSVGWIFSAIGLLTGTGVLAMSYAEYALTARGVMLPGTVLAAWYSEWFWYPLIGLASTFTLLVFPTGRLPSPRWRPIAGLSAAAIAVMIALSAVQPNVGATVTVNNPIGLPGIPDPEAGVLGAVTIATILACGGAAALSLVLRFRRSHGVERQQLKWFTYAGVLMAGCFVLSDLFPDHVLSGLFGVAVGLVPVAAGIAILHYRLYDIDRLIRRTLTYSLLTALLAGVYAGAVLILGEVFGRIDGDAPSWAIASATLAIAALTQPARHRIQTEVDRRFNRSRYDAAKTIAALSERLRDELDPDAVGVQLLAATRQTMQPSQASLWLRPPVRAARR
jgi:hypothetical protein